MLVPDTTSRSTMDLRSWQGIIVGYEANNQWRIHNPITKKLHISRDVRFDEGYIYDSQLNERNEEVGEFWSPKDDEQLALQEKEQEDMIIRCRKETVGNFAAGAAMQNNVKDQKRVSAGSDDESALSSLDDDEPLIPPDPMDPPIIRIFSAHLVRYHPTRYPPRFSVYWHHWGA